MATSTVSPSMSNYEQIGAALTEAPEPSQAEAPATPAETSPAETETESTETPVETPAAVETSAETPADATAETEPENPYEQEPDAEVAPQTLDVLLKTPRGKEIYASHKLNREIAKEIGHVPTVEQAAQYYGAYRDQVLMNEDLSSGNPQQAERLISHLFHPNRGEGAHVVAAKLGEVLAKTSPEAYAAAAQPFIANYGNELWDRFEKATDPAVKQALYQAAQLVHKDFTGKWKDVKNGQLANATEADPLANERAELAQERERVQQIRQQQAESDQRRWTNEFGATVAKGMFDELDKALAPLKSLYKDTPKRYERSRKIFHDEVVSEVPKNRQAWDLYQVQLAKARRSGSQEDREAAAREYVKLATPVILAKRKQFLEEEGVAVKQASDARHTELRSIESHQAPSNGGPPVKPSTGPPLERKPGESQTAWNLRQLRS
jgi:hypothetical protein